MEGTVGSDIASARSSPFPRTSRLAEAKAAFLFGVIEMTRGLKPDRTFKNQKLAKTRGRREKLAVDRTRAEVVADRRRNDLLPALQIESMAVPDLRASPRHARRLAEEHIDRLVASIADLGFTSPILVRDGEIVDGRVRVEAARRLGLDRVPAIEVAHLTDTEVRKLRLALNRTAELGEWDLDRLRIEIEELVELDVDLTSTGFGRQDLDIILLDDVGAATAEDVLPPVPETAVTRAGDVWLLGDHRIVCGNALTPEVYATVLAGDRVHLVLSDLPYNVKIAGNVSGLGKTMHGEFAMASGEMSDGEWQAFLDAVLAQLAAVVVEGGGIFAFMDWRSIHRLYAAGSGAGLSLINLAVWYKEAGSMGTLYRSAHELIAIFCKGTRPRINNVELGRHGRDRSNVWCAPGANRPGSSANAMLAFHATPKPVELCVDAILDVTERGDIVLDAFLGSGTTLIAAEKSGRSCRGIEIEPRFVDVAVRRWQAFTGKSATLAVTGTTFDEVEVCRAAEQASSSAEARHD